MTHISYTKDQKLESIYAKTKTKQESDIVFKQFEDQISEYTLNALVECSAVTPFLQKWFKKTKPQKFVDLRIWRWGGNVLKHIEVQTKIKTKLTNIELVGKYKKSQVDKKSILFKVQ
ncbi:MAG: hypothetical protein ABI758_03430 [Candidatus Woesebacteria bacterium]